MTIIAGIIDQYVAPAQVDIPYVTGAVHFNGSTYLSRGAALTGWGTPNKFTCALWTKLSAANDGIFSDANYFTQGATTPGGGNYYINFNVRNYYWDSSTTAKITSTGWQCLLASLDISVANAGSPDLYLGDTDVLVPANSTTSSSTTIPAGSNFYFGQDGFNVKITGDVADFRLWFGTALDFSNINNRRLFVRANGKPADRAAAVTLMGTPIVQFVATPGSEVATFSVNGGTGGAFTTTGTLTVASSSPTD